jgi:hypothetical protein
MAQNLRKPVARRLEELRAEYRRARAWFWDATKRLDAAWERGRKNFADAPTGEKQVEVLWRLEADLAPLLQAIPADAPPAPERGKGGHTASEPS